MHIGNDCVSMDVHLFDLRTGTVRYVCILLLKVVLSHLVEIHCSVFTFSRYFTDPDSTVGRASTSGHVDPGQIMGHVTLNTVKKGVVTSLLGVQF